jgi:SulP family sulfate permease
MKSSRPHLFSLRIAHAFRESVLQGHYHRDQFKRDLIAGLTVGLIAIPLSMALAIACGVAPQYGLYTAIVAGFIIALTGGSRVSISGPTAAFVVILVPVVQRFGISGLLVATALSGLILIAMAFMRLGRFIEYIPEPVTLGFTAGIAVVIATLQIKDVLGLPVMDLPNHFLAKWPVLIDNLPALDWASLTVAVVTFATLLLWHRVSRVLPAHIPALLIGTLVAWLFGIAGHEVATIGSRFQYLDAGGQLLFGIPAQLPHWVWPWQMQVGESQALTWDWATVQGLLSAAFAMAMLGAIESLLCAVVLDGMTHHRHSANSELLGQGIGNIIAPFFGGFTATAALARSAANVRAGGTSPVAAITHALVVLFALAFCTRWLAWLPMSAMAALLLMVAWNMSEAHKAVQLIRRSPKEDIWVFLTCFSLTVLFDMVIAITIGILLAAILFMQQLARLTRLIPQLGLDAAEVPAGWFVFRIQGPLFFAAADRIFSELSDLSPDARGIIVNMSGVDLLDAGGLSALEKLIDQCTKRKTKLVICELSFQPLKTLARAKMVPIAGVLTFKSTTLDALALAHTRAELGSQASLGG